MAFQEVDAVEVCEVMRSWRDGGGSRTIAERAGVDRRAARQCVQAAQPAGLVRNAGSAALGDELIGLVVDRARPARPIGHGSVWDAVACQPEGTGSLPRAWNRASNCSRTHRDNPRDRTRLQWPWANGSALAQLKSLTVLHQVHGPHR